MHAERVGELMGKQDLIGVVFAGGLSELPFLNARQILVNDKHSQLFNLCRVLSLWEESFPELLKECVYHPQELADARDCLDTTDMVLRAKAFFIINWMTRCSGGMEDAESGSLAMRWTASGGSSIARWNAAVDGLHKWSELLRSKCECTCLDWRQFSEKWKDRLGHGLYLDPPWIGAGDDYLHKFTPDDHRSLAKWANEQVHTTVVVRHSAHADYVRYYKVEDGWEWFLVDAKNQAGKSTGEVLIRRIGKA